jgi:transcriptional regulator with PAS, ATPase and Fis domain/tetratricopeptide (TPR) repeat protein
VLKSFRATEVHHLEKKQMGLLKEAKRLVRAGQYRDAATTLAAGNVERSEKTQTEVLRIEVLERLGQYALAKREAELLLRAPERLTAGERSACRVVIARAAVEDGLFENARVLLQQAITLALDAGDYERAFWAQLRLLQILSDLSGADATVSLLADLRTSAARTGDSMIRAALHLFVGQIEAKRGLLSTARRHVRVALGLLSEEHNAWLESVAEHISVAIAIMRADTAGALEHAPRAVELATLSGVANSSATSFGNLATTLYFTGQYDAAVEQQARATQGFPPRSHSHLAALDILARIRLAQNRLDDCDGLLDLIVNMAEPAGPARYVYRHALLLRAVALARRGHYQEAIDQLKTTQSLADNSGDSLLLHLAILTRVELLGISGHTREALEALERVHLSILSQPPDVYALHERAIASTLWSDGQHHAAVGHINRAERIYHTVNHVPGLTDIVWLRGVTTDRAKPSEPDQPWPRTEAIQEITTLLGFAGRPELIAREIVALLLNANCVRFAYAVLRVEDKEEELLFNHGVLATADDGARRMLQIGEWRGGTIFVIIDPKPDAQSIATIHALERLVGSIRELDRAHVNNEERMTLWTTDASSFQGEGVALSGHMRELMQYARRIAQAPVNVLITGESGTGKEILARAIHEHSDRARKPFVPFNCAAIPRDLLESQLFGHRRGAFTGADRDHLGMIRTARDGTLFLDEVGELGLDLQPKLLRFLESGEIAPLGEPSPLTVPVRVIAATNTHLEDAVRAGRFREDLFYRLNVVRLSIRPLRERRDEIPGFVSHFVARAAHEFHKGHLQVAEETMERLLLYRWPGNVRQLQNEIRRMVALAEPNATLLPRAISEDILGALPNLSIVPVNGSELRVPLHDKLMPTLARIESEMIKAALVQHGGRVEDVAKALGISRKGLYLKRQRLGL